MVNSNEITVFAETNFRNKKVRFGIKEDDRRRHIYLIGKTGVGKSNCIENMVISDIQRGRGVALVDPHGESVEKVVKYIPSNRVNDVVYFNPSDTEHPIAFNILEEVNPQYKNLIASGLVGVFKKIWADSWGPRLEYILMNTILALLENPGSTLLGITRLLVDKTYRKKIVSNLTDPIVKAFWIDEYANYNERFRTEAISPIQNKVGQFLSSAIIRNIVGQPKSTIDMRNIMDKKKILLMNLAKGRIGEENSALLGAMMITKLQLAAMSRVDIAEEDREDFYLYVDEFQNFSTESFANILSEARKYRLNLTIAHQYIEQLGDVVKAAVFGNVGTIVCFRVGAEDAEFLEKEFEPYFLLNDLVNLPKYNVYMKLMIDGIASAPFSATILPPIQGETGNLEKIITSSRERYARPLKVVEEKILRWSGVEEMYRGAANEETVTKPAPQYKKPFSSSNKISENNERAPNESKPKPKSVVKISEGPVEPEIDLPPTEIRLNDALKQGPVSFSESRKRNPVSTQNSNKKRGDRNRKKKRRNPKTHNGNQQVPRLEPKSYNNQTPKQQSDNHILEQGQSVKFDK
ncbi:type IV secretion system DNA-binding domain-containing protein [Patescibacteria group bacterium]|nr:type IV secretion system DNA-binding domain-containing protein [Patescibacteria group bacterium]